MSKLAEDERAWARPERVDGFGGIGAGTLVLTLDGEIPVEHLVEGDRLVTRSGARTLRRITSRLARGAYVVAQKAMGDDRPQAPVTLGATQGLLLRDWRARALCNRDSAVMPANRLADGEYIAPADGPVRLWRLEFDREEVIYAGGLELTAPAAATALV